MGKLIMPKQTGELCKCKASLEILKEAHGTINNSDYKDAIIKKFNNFTKNSDGAMLVKQSEITRYFGFMIRDFSAKTNSITPEGRLFYEALISNNKSNQFKLLTNAIKSISFGRNNTAIKNSDSDIDPPKLFVKSIIELDGITKYEFATLLYLTHNLQLNFNDSILEIRNSRNNKKEIKLPKSVLGKYSDTKFPPFLVEVKFCYLKKKKYYLDSTISTEFSSMNIYNTTPNNLKTLTDEILETTDSIENDLTDIYIKNVSKTLSYDKESVSFKNQNNRLPQQKNDTSISGKYVTNSRIGKTALESAKYFCENDNSHTTFLNKYGVQFTEPHHLIPMSAQKDFNINLDRIENIISLCPNCHSAIHYGNNEVRKTILKKLYDKRIKILNDSKIDISFKTLFEKYYK